MDRGTVARREIICIQTGLVMGRWDERGKRWGMRKGTIGRLEGKVWGMLKGKMGKLENKSMGYEGC